MIFARISSFNLVTVKCDVACLKLFAGAAIGGFEAVQFGIVLAGEAAVGGLTVLLFAWTIVKSMMGIDPDLDVRIPL